MRTRSIIMLGLIALVLVVSTVFAQPGGGRPGRATPVSTVFLLSSPTPLTLGRPSGTPAVPGLSGTATRPFPIATGTRTFPTLTASPTGGGFARSTRIPGGMAETVTAMPDDFVDEFSSYMQETYGVSLPDDLGASSPEALGMLTSFAADYLGFVPVMMYANQTDLDSIDSASMEILLSNFPDEISQMTALLESMASIVYGGLYEDGVALVYTGTCSGTPCATNEGQMQFVLEEGALGIYGTYVSGDVSDANTALLILQQTFPTLGAITLSAPTTETGGYSFTGQTTAQTNRISTITAYYVGTYTVGTTTLVYAIIGIGEGYAEFVRP